MKLLCFVNPFNVVSDHKFSSSFACRLWESNRSLTTIKMYPFNPETQFSAEYWTKKISIQDVVDRNRRIHRRWFCLAPWIGFSRANGLSHSLLNSFQDLVPLILVQKAHFSLIFSLCLITPRNMRVMQQSRGFEVCCFYFKLGLLF